MENLLVSFSGGETSAYMAQWLKANRSDEFNMVFVFANTGEENEETLEFVERCDKHFGLDVKWVEAVISTEKGKGTRHKNVTYQTASRKGEPFEAMIKKYGLPNKAAPHCTRETKLNPITSFAREYFGRNDYYTAIGIRIDEADRMNDNYKKNRLYYPLITEQPMTKPKINFWWSQQPFRLNLKGYQGNCKTCWKKSDKKLYTIVKENPEHFDFMRRMEAKYPRTGNEFTKENADKFPNRTFFRGNRSVEDIFNEAKNFNGFVRDDSVELNYQVNLFEQIQEMESESCEVWSNCGDK